MSNLIESVLAKLVVEQPWFAALALRLRCEESTELPTLGTDGIRLYWNKTFLEKLPKKQRLAVVAHEVLHVVFKHMTRRGHRDKALWNCAGDFVINQELKDSGFDLPAECLYDERFKGMDTIQVYNILEKEAKKLKCMGCVSDLGKGEKDEDGESVTTAGLEADWDVAIAQATSIAEKAGKLPASLARTLNALRAGRKDWRAVLHRYLTIPGDYSWMRPNRRHVADGLYLPGSIIDSINTIVIAVDTSGSVDHALLSLFGAEVKQILAFAGVPQRIVLIYCDAEVNSYEEVEGDFDLKPHGGGGTAFQPVFDRVAAEGLEPSVLFYLTDLYGDNPKEPSYPVVWVAPEGGSGKEPFGELIKIDTKE